MISKRADVIDGFARVVLCNLLKREVVGSDPLAWPGKESDWFSNCMDFSADGTKLLIGTTGQLAWLLDSVTGKPLIPPLPHPGRVTAVAFSPDGRWALTGCSDRKIRAWELSGGPREVFFVEAQGEVGRLAFSRDGQAFLAEWKMHDYGEPRNITQVWDWATHHRVGPRFLLASKAWGPRSAFCSTHPLVGDSRMLTLWVQLITGKKLTTDGSVCDLDLPELLERQRQIDTDLDDRTRH
jgi:WD40 repeat protein